MWSNVYFIRREAFLKALPARYIYPSREGQNNQLVLPIAYYCQYGYVNEPLLVKVFRPVSHGHFKRTFRQSVDRNDGILELITYTLKEMHMPPIDEEKALYFIRVKLTRANLVIGIRHSNEKIINKCLKFAREYDLTIFNKYFEIRNVMSKYVAVLKMPKKVFDWLMPFIGKKLSRFCGEEKFADIVKKFDADGIISGDLSNVAASLDKNMFYVFIVDDYKTLRSSLIDSGFKENADFLDGRNLLK